VPVLVGITASWGSDFELVMLLDMNELNDRTDQIAGREVKVHLVGAYVPSSLGLSLSPVKWTNST
jgi:hypothetical protein